MLKKLESDEKIVKIENRQEVKCRRVIQFYAMFFNLFLFVFFPLYCKINTWVKKCMTLKNCRNWCFSVFSKNDSSFFKFQFIRKFWNFRQNDNLNLNKSTPNTQNWWPQHLSILQQPSTHFANAVKNNNLK